jgi:hypothetical protein
MDFTAPLRNNALKKRKGVADDYGRVLKSRRLTAENAKVEITQPSTVQNPGRNPPTDQIERFKKFSGHSERGFLAFWRGFGKGAGPRRSCG